MNIKVFWDTIKTWNVLVYLYEVFISLGDIGVGRDLTSDTNIQEDKMKRINYFKKLVMALLVVVLAISFPVTKDASAATNAITAAIDGTKVNFSNDPIMKDGTTLVPFRAIFEALQLKVGWNQATQTATGSNDTLKVELVMGSKSAKVNGKTVSLAQAPSVINGSTMVPLRFVAEASGAVVYWDNKKRHIDILFNEDIKFNKAAYYNDTASLSAWLKKGKTIEQTYNGQTPLIAAASGNSLDAVKLLLSNGANVDARTATNWTPLLWAAYHENDAMIKELLDYNADSSYTVGSTQDQIKAQNNLTNYLKFGSTYSPLNGDIYLPVAWGTEADVVKSRLKDSYNYGDTVNGSYRQYYETYLENGSYADAMYTYKNMKLTKITYLSTYEYGEFDTAIDDYLYELKRYKSLHRSNLKFNEIWGVPSDEQVYSNVYGVDSYEKYETALWLDDVAFTASEQKNGMKYTINLFAYNNGVALTIEYSK